MILMLIWFMKSTAIDTHHSKSQNEHQFRNCPQLFDEKTIKLIYNAIDKGAKLYGSVSGGKDGQAMVKSLHDIAMPLTGLIHADLGKVEWKESMPQCQKNSEACNVPLYVCRRKDGAGLLEYWQRRMLKVEGQGIPFWSSANIRYCTSDLKRGPINVFFIATGNDFIISCEGIRADESPKRSQKPAISIRSNSSTFYAGMTPDQAINAYRPGKKLILTWYPVFNYTLEDVWITHGMTPLLLQAARTEYNHTGIVPAWWPFHPAYAYGNDRVSCRYCIMGSLNDLKTAAKHNDDGLLEEMIQMEEYSGFTFKNDFSLKQL